MKMFVSDTLSLTKLFLSRNQPFQAPVLYTASPGRTFLSVKKAVIF